LLGHEAAALRSMNRLRAEERFCDVTIVARSLRFRGHRVILAACSPFLRDQFLLNPAAELRVSLAHSARVLADLLLSCYTGALEFAGRDLVNYLTAASYLQMEHVVERCRGALARVIQAPPPAPAPPPPPAPAAACPPRPSLRPPARPSLLQAPLQTPRPPLLPKPEEEEEEEEEEEAEAAAADVCIVKVGEGEGVRRGLGALGRVREGDPGTGRGGKVCSSLAPAEPGHGLGAQPLGVVKACYSLAEDAEGEGLLLFPGISTASGEEPSGGGGGGGGGSGGGSAGNLLGASAPSAMASASVTSSAMLSLAPGPSQCGKCGDAFQGVEKLVFHMRAQHLVFMCPRCGKQFNHSSNLNRHMNVHRGVKSHGCGVCGKSFTQKSTLHDHMNLHSGERPYRCSYCDVRFAHKPAIRRHLKEQHGKTTAENVLEASVAEVSVLLR
ncbi:ZBT12 protein, partial [Galbula dea]|nr:ZBT12 protein [Galbula dea]